MEGPAFPIIDIGIYRQSLEQSGLSEEQYRAKKAQVADQMRDACEKVGFFYTTNHGVEDPSRVLKTAKEFFDLSEEEKNKIAISNSKDCKGYQKLGQNVTQYQKDWHEAIDLYYELSNDNPESKKPMHGPNQWPEKPENFKQVFSDYVDQMTKLGECVMACLAASLGLPEDFFIKEYISNPFWCMRIIGYPPLSTSNTEGISCGEHCDYGCLTMVNQDSTPGALQVRNAKGEWINAEPIPGAFVTNIGDMVKVWTNGRYQSTLHRVVNKANKYRVSVPFFYEPNFETVVKPLDVCLGKGPRFPPIKYGDHLLSKVLSNFDFNYHERKDSPIG